MHLVERKTCRLCGSSALTRVIQLGEQYLQGAFIKPGAPNPARRKIPLNLVRCDPQRDEKACGLLQLEHTVPGEILYSQYWYRSGTTATMRAHLQGVVGELNSIFQGKAFRALDIGCNDGTLLSFFPPGVERFGIDPSSVASTAQVKATIINDFFPSKRLTQAAAGKKFDAITSIAMFYDLEDPLSFCQAIKEVLAENGVWIFEMSYMPKMLQGDSYDTICHEHLEYYSLAIVEKMLGRTGLEVFRAELNDSNGGSIRCYATHAGGTVLSTEESRRALHEFRMREFELELDTDKPYRGFQGRIEGHRERLHDLLLSLRSDGKKIHLYGASTKGNTILQWCGIDQSLVECAAERNPEKFGAKTIGTHIPIVSEADSRALNPDYYLVLPWHFKKEILEREKATMERGVKLIFPLPTIEIWPK